MACDGALLSFLTLAPDFAVVLGFLAAMVRIMYSVLYNAGPVLQWEVREALSTSHHSMVREKSGNQCEQGLEGEGEN